MHRDAITLSASRQEIINWTRTSSPEKYSEIVLDALAAVLQLKFDHDKTGTTLADPRARSQIG